MKENFVKQIIGQWSRIAPSVQILILIAAVVAMLLAMIFIPGCLNPPIGTVFIDVDGDGRIDALAQDLDHDGLPDLDANGHAMIIAGSQGYGVAERIDEISPGILGAIGGLLGLPVLVGIGAAWKGARFARIFQNTIMSVQMARKALKDLDMTGALAVVDAALNEQPQATQAAVEKAKGKMGLSSVTDQPKNEAASG